MSKKIKVYMGIPSTGDRCDWHVYLFRDLQDRYGDKVEMVFPDNCVHRFGHDFARNEIVEEFLASDCDVLWFLDSDVAPPNFVFDLLVNDYDKWEVAGAPYPIYMMLPGQQQMSIQFTAYSGLAKSEDGGEGITLCPVPKEGTEWVDALATGCLFIKRSVFAKLERPYFEFKRHPKTMRVIEGEDLGFALKLNKLGIRFFCNHGMVCKHYKRIDLLEMNNYATDMSNAKIMEYDAEIKKTINTALNTVKKQGFEAGYQAGYEAAQGSLGPQITKSGLIIPSHVR